MCTRRRSKCASATAVPCTSSFSTPCSARWRRRRPRPSAACRRPCRPLPAWAAIPRARVWAAQASGAASRRRPRSARNSRTPSRPPRPARTFPSLPTRQAWPRTRRPMAPCSAAQVPPTRRSRKWNRTSPRPKRCRAKSIRWALPWPSCMASTSWRRTPRAWCWSTCTRRTSASCTSS
ncbi:hypothetical protein D3C81_1637260 [compost metagenome]